MTEFRAKQYLKARMRRAKIRVRERGVCGCVGAGGGAGRETETERNRGRIVERNGNDIGWRLSIALMYDFKTAVHPQLL